MRLKDIFKRKKRRAMGNKSTINKKASKKRVSKKKPLRKKLPTTKKKTLKEKPVQLSRNECPECGSDNIVISQMTGNTICQDCGAIFAGLMPEVEKKFYEVKKQG